MKKNKEKGITLYLTILILSIVLAICLGMGTILVSQIKMISSMGDSVKAFFAADTGMERILYEDKLCRVECPPLCSECGENCPPDCRQDEEPCPCPENCVRDENPPYACQGLPSSPENYLFFEDLLSPDSFSCDSKYCYWATFFTEDGYSNFKSIGLYRNVRRAILAQRGE